MNSNIWKKSAVISYVAVIVLIVIAIITGVSLSSGSADGKPEGDGDTKALIDILTVTTVNVDCVDVVNATGGSTKAIDGKTYVVYDIGATKPTPPRKWSDAISTPLQGKSPPDKLRHAQGAVCEDPLYGVTVANFLANLNVDGVNVGDLNPWLAPYKGSPEQINDKAAAFVPLLDVKSPNETQVEKAAQKNLEYQEFAARLDTLLGRFKVDGIHSLKSVENLHLVGGGLKVSGLPEVGVNRHQEALPALVLSVTLKGACAPAKVIGLNTGDKRPEVFATPTCKQPPSTSTCKGSNCNPSTSCKDRGDCPGTPTCKDRGDCPNPTCEDKGNCPTPTPTPCDCVDPTEVNQPVPTPDSGPSGVPTHEPSAQPTHPVDPSSPPTPNDGGNNGGSTQQPGQSGSPDPAVPSSEPSNGGDPGL